MTDRRTLRLLPIVVCAFALVIAACSGGGSKSTAGEPGSSSTTTKKGDPLAQYRRAGWVAEENAKPGTSDWTIPDDRVMWSKIEGFADRTSVNIGEPTTLRVNSKGSPWRVSAYRIGYYGGKGGRLVWRSDPQAATNQPAPVQTAATKTWSASNWSPSITVQTSAEWPPGQYMLRLESDNGGATFVPLVVRDDASHSDLLVQSAVTTWQAYNGWGGASIYTGNNGRADATSFDRPYTGNGSGEFLGREFEFDYFLERNGYDVSYWTNVDLDQRGELALNHRAILIPGHDEYYTVRMRENLEKARDAGVNIAFFGANNVYRRIRLEDSPLGPGRTEVNYRSATTDPFNRIDPRQVTTSFREPPEANPESSLTGSYYECNPVDADWVVGDSSMWMFEGSGFKDGDKVKGMVGNEYDRVTQGVPTPRNISVLAHSPVTCKTLKSFADTTYYTAPSGAAVFDAATFGWTPLMDDECPNGVATSPPCRLQKVTLNLITAFAKGPAGNEHPSVSNLAKFSIPAPNKPIF